jgi:hypothetical protein
MSFREWLPITNRNRVALALAALSLALFLGWNCMPYYESEGVSSKEIVATLVWPEVFSPGNYTAVIHTPDIDGFLEVIAYLAVLLSGLVILMGVPLWVFLHASNYIRLPLALMNLLGGSVIVWHLFDSVLVDPEPFWVATIILMIVSMFAISAALFTFKNELALREARKHGISDE